MNTKIEKIQRAGRVAMVVVLLVMACMAFLVGRSSYTILRSGLGFLGGPESAPFRLTILTNLVFFAGICVITVLIVLMLRSIQKEQSPFTAKNVRRLKGTGLTLVAIEVWEVVWTIIYQSWFYYSGDPLYFVNSMGGILFVVGVVVYCIGLVFEYGMVLQQESDETL